MKQLICHQMRIISDAELAQVYGGMASKETVQRLRRSPNCVAAANNVHNGYGSGHNAGGYGGGSNNNQYGSGGSHQR